MKASIKETTVMIPTYKTALPEKSPIFIEKRAYQGSTGKVYPLPVTEKLGDEKEMKAYKALILENEYIYVMVLPELGGRIQRAYDKTNGYDFVYYNHVIKPALVGLAGPWISGGIEFNWPQHHRPSTFSPVDYSISENEDGSVTAYVGETDVMYGTKCTASITLYPGKAYIEIKGQLYNPTDFPQTFLWWANPAVAVNDKTFSVFPPDVNAVMDHGKRAVSTFPIATGEYYKYDYSAGIDISRYKNIKVPTSYMAAHSDFDFIGNFDEGRDAGLLHIADHHISPGKKQWTWGCGDFGRMWDKNLTDEDGPYIELMTGIFTDNQPDFTWLKPNEEKTFTQYFMPYKTVGRVGNATKDVVIGVEGRQIKVYASGKYPGARITAAVKGKPVYEKTADLSPERCFVDQIEEDIPSTSTAEDARLASPAESAPSASPAESVPSASPAGGVPSASPAESVPLASPAGGVPSASSAECVPSASSAEGVSSANVQMGAPLHDYVIQVWDQEGKLLGEYREYIPGDLPVPDPAEVLKAPEEISSLEELYLGGQHLEQYRHATYNPAGYYLEGLRRDPTDIRLNQAYGLLLMRNGQIKESIPYFKRAIEKQTWRNPNPYSGECYYSLGTAYRLLGEYDKAYDAFYKSTWSFETQSSGFYHLACICVRRGEWEKALAFAEKSLAGNNHNQRARTLKAELMKQVKKDNRQFLKESYELDRLSLGIAWQYLDGEAFAKAMGGRLVNYLKVSLLYMEFGFYEKAVELLELCETESPLVEYYKGYAWGQLGRTEESIQCCRKAETRSSDYCFPNTIEEMLILAYAIRLLGQAPMASYYLGNLLYDKKQYEKAVSCWENTASLKPDFAMAWRNLSIAYYNKEEEPEKALSAIGKACSLENGNSRFLLEQAQLGAKAGVSSAQRLKLLEEHKELLEDRDTLCLAYITLLNENGRWEEALELLRRHVFHVWEGGEGKVAEQYKISLFALAGAAMDKGDYAGALELCRQTITYPENLGEGKLPNVPDNQAYYLMGVCCRKLGEEEKAKGFFRLAAEGSQTPEPVRYYNDQPSDYIYYIGLALLALGKKAEAKAAFQKLVDFGRAHETEKVGYDFFAVSLPELEVYQDDLQKRSKAYCERLIALGEKGLNMP